MEQTKIDEALDIDLDKPLICEVKWYKPSTNGVFPCGNEATWTALAHDEIDDHTYEKILLCGECVILANYKNQCPDCGADILIGLRRL